MPWDMCGVDTAGDYYQWCRDSQMYMTQAEVASLVRQPRGDWRHIIVDTRDEDCAGGRVKGALHLADGSDWTENISVLIKAIAEVKAKVVIFHCMESIRRGPRCARRLYNYYVEDGEEDMPAIKILQGGADQWIRKYYKSDLVEDFDDDYWGFEGYNIENSRTDEKASHILYSRPSDQHIDASGNLC